MRWRSECPIPLWLEQLRYTDRVLALGSCFAQTIGQRLLDYGQRGHCNPFGAVYNPISMSQQLQRLLGGQRYVQSDFFEHDGLWRHFELHSSLAEPGLPEAVSRANQAVQQASTAVQQTRWLILTFGSAHVWQLRSSGQVVSNCHRLPQQQFRRRMASLMECESALVPVLRQLLERHSQLQLVVTVSPVRYLRDGLVASQRSKSRLHELVQRIELELPDRVTYFPAYELQIDELRDYRFTGRDLCHPTAEAEDYIWERFIDAAADHRAHQFFKRGEALHRLRQHRPQHLHRELAWREQCAQQAQRFRAEFPWGDT